MSLNSYLSSSLNLLCLNSADNWEVVPGGISYELPSLNQISSSARLDWRQEFGLFIGLISPVSLTSCPCLIQHHPICLTYTAGGVPVETFLFRRPRTSYGLLMLPMIGLAPAIIWLMRRIIPIFCYPFPPSNQ